MSLESLQKIREFLKFPKHKPFNREFRKFWEQDEKERKILVNFFSEIMGMHHEVVLFSKIPKSTVPQNSKDVFQDQPVYIKHRHFHSNYCLIFFLRSRRRPVDIIMALIHSMGFHVFHG